MPRIRSVLVLLVCVPWISAADWPQWLGPTRDGVYTGNDIATSFPASGPPIVWKKDVGEGFAAPILSSI